MTTLAQLRTFVTVAHLNSFSRAAEQLHLTQPAVSAQVGALEDALGARLFDRIGKKIALSASGKLVLDASEAVLCRLERLRGDLADLKSLRAGRLSIGASQVAGVYLLPELLAAFRVEYPGIDADVRIEPARRVVEMLAEGEIDCAVIGEGAPITDPRVAIKPIARDELVLIVPNGHVFAQMTTVAPRSLAQFPFVLPRRDSASSEHLLDQLAAVGIRLDNVLELGNIGAVKRAVEAGLGVSIVSRIAVAHELQDGRLKSVYMEQLQIERDIALCWNHERSFSRATEAFIGFLHRRAGLGPPVAADNPPDATPASLADIAG